MFHLSYTLSLPDEAAHWRLGIFGRTGSGKTNTAVVLAEQMISAGIPIVILDPQGDEADLFCLTDDTEVLTRRGWKSRQQIRVGEDAVCFNLDSSTYEYGDIKRLITKEFSGELVHLKTKSLDCLTTPDHRVVLRRIQRALGRYGAVDYPWTFCEAQNVPQHIHIPIGGAPHGDGIRELADYQLRLLGWLMTDGNFHDRTKRSLVLTQASETEKGGVRVADEMQTALRDLPDVSVAHRGPRQHEYQGRMIRSSDSISIYIGVKTSSMLIPWLNKEDLHSIPRRLLEECSLPQLKSLWQGLVEGNGHHNARLGWTHFYPGKRQRFADEFQELCTRIGVSTKLRFVDSIAQYCVTMAHQRRHHHVRKPRPVAYDGVVWDVTVPTGAFVARRHGTVFVTGNCPQKTGAAR